MHDPCWRCMHTSDAQIFGPVASRMGHADGRHATIRAFGVRLDDHRRSKCAQLHVHGRLENPWPDQISEKTDLLASDAGV